jgi:tetratricopeptide (TPR) repeat protein
VEKALALLPDLEAVAPLRALLVGISRPDESTRWSSSGPYLTLGKRGVQPQELERGMAHMLQLITVQLQAVYEAYVRALEAQQRAAGDQVVAALLEAGALEETAGRLPHAAAWYDIALRASEGLQERRPEVAALHAAGRLSLGMGRHADSARHFQRSLALAEAEIDQIGAMVSCEGLGDTEFAQGRWTGAHAWYARGLRLAEASSDRGWLARLERHLGELAREQGNGAAAEEHLRQAREALDATAMPEEMARVLHAQGHLDAELGRDAAAAATFREALAWAQRAPGNRALELSVRLSLAELHLEAGRLFEADEELRRAEQMAITGNLMGELVRIYTVMGNLSGRQLDETGFVFFEQAIELGRALARSPATEAQVCLEYGRFREALDQRDEARAYLERARDLFDAAGEARERGRVDAELQKLAPSRVP